MNFIKKYKNILILNLFLTISMYLLCWLFLYKNIAEFSYMFLYPILFTLCSLSLSCYLAKKKNIKLLREESLLKRILIPNLLSLFIILVVSLNFIFSRDIEDGRRAAIKLVFFYIFYLLISLYKDFFVSKDKNISE